jgi:ATP-binding cassette subfamily C (CFTR/MRP) protein 10
MGPEGSVIAHGSFQDILQSEDEHVRTILQSFSNDDDDGNGSSKPTDKPSQNHNHGSSQPSDDEQQHHTVNNQRSKISNRNCSIEKNLDQYKQKSSKSVQMFTDNEARAQGHVKLRYLYHYAKCFGSISIVVLILMIVIADQTLGIFQNVYYSIITKHCDDSNTHEDHPRGCSRSYNITSLIFIILFVLSILTLRSVRVGLLLYGAQTAARIFHEDLLKALLGAKIYFFDRQLSGRILNRIIADVASIDLTIPTTFTGFLNSLSSLLSSIVLIVVKLPAILIIAVLIAVPYYKIYQFYRWPARDLKRLDSMAKSPINSQLVEVLDGLSTIRAFGCQVIQLKEHLHLARERYALHALHSPLSP